MKFYGKTQQVADDIVAAFEQGDIPKALAQVFIHKKEDRPCARWSWCNQLLVALHGCTDARGIRQWNAVGRSVNKGEKAFAILAPRFITKHNEETDEDDLELIGFISVPVFGYEQTHGQDLSDLNPELTTWCNNLPLREVAEEWGLTVGTYNGQGARYEGYYRQGQGIALGVKNLSTWTHELVHAADDKLRGGLKGGQHPEQEIVAELGAAVMLEIIGMPHQSDRGGCWQYIKTYADKAKIAPITAINRVLDRTCKAVSLILETAEAVNQPSVAA